MINSTESFNGGDISFTAKDLYVQACQHNEKGERDEMYEISTILIEKYPESKEAKWAIRNFSPFWSPDEKKVINIQSYFSFGRGFLHAFGFFIPIYNIVRFIEITKGRTLRPLWIAILFSLVILNTFVLKSSVPSIYPVGFLSLLYLITWLLYKQSTTQYAFGNLVGILIMSALWILISEASALLFCR